MREVEGAGEQLSGDELKSDSRDLLFRGVERLVGALKVFSTRKPQGKVLVALDGGNTGRTQPPAVASARGS